MKRVWSKVIVTGFLAWGLTHGAAFAQSAMMTYSVIPHALAGLVAGATKRAACSVTVKCKQDLRNMLALEGLSDQIIIGSSREDGRGFYIEAKSEAVAQIRGIFANVASIEEASIEDIRVLSEKKNGEYKNLPFEEWQQLISGGGGNTARFIPNVGADTERLQRELKQNDPARLEDSFKRGTERTATEAAKAEETRRRLHK